MNFLFANLFNSLLFSACLVKLENKHTISMKSPSIFIALLGFLIIPLVHNAQSLTKLSTTNWFVFVECYTRDCLYIFHKLNPRNFHTFGMTMVRFQHCFNIKSKIDQCVQKKHFNMTVSPINPQDNKDVTSEMLDKAKQMHCGYAMVQSAIYSIWRTQFEWKLLSNKLFQNNVTFQKFYLSPKPFQESNCLNQLIISKGTFRTFNHSVERDKYIKDLNKWTYCGMKPPWSFYSDVSDTLIVYTFRKNHQSLFAPNVLHFNFQPIDKDVAETLDYDDQVNLLSHLTPQYNFVLEPVLKYHTTVLYHLHVQCHKFQQITVNKIQISKRFSVFESKIYLSNAPGTRMNLLTTETHKNPSSQDSVVKQPLIMDGFQFVLKIILSPHQSFPQNITTVIVMSLGMKRNIKKVISKQMDLKLTFYNVQSLVKVWNFHAPFNHYIQLSVHSYGYHGNADSYCSHAGFSVFNMVNSTFGEEEFTVCGGESLHFSDSNKTELFVLVSSSSNLRLVTCNYLSDVKMNLSLKISVTRCKGYFRKFQTTIKPVLLEFWNVYFEDLLGNYAHYLALEKCFVVQDFEMNSHRLVALGTTLLCSFFPTGTSSQHDIFFKFSFSLSVNNRQQTQNLLSIKLHPFLNAHRQLLQFKIQGIVTKSTLDPVLRMQGIEIYDSRGRAQPKTLEMLAMITKQCRIYSSSSQFLDERFSVTFVQQPCVAKVSQSVNFCTDVVFNIGRALEWVKKDKGKPLDVTAGRLKHNTLNTHFVNCQECIGKIGILTIQEKMVDFKCSGLSIVLCASNQKVKHSLPVAEYNVFVDSDRQILLHNGADLHLKFILNRKFKILDKETRSPCLHKCSIIFQNTHTFSKHLLFTRNR